MPIRQGGSGLGGQFSGVTRWTERPATVKIYPDRLCYSRAQPDDLPSDHRAIVPNPATNRVLVGHMGGGKYQIHKNGGTDGFYDSDAVSSVAISGDVEVVAEWAAGASGFVGLNPNDPTLDGTYGTGQTMILVQTGSGLIDPVWSLYNRFGGFVGNDGAVGKKYGRLVYVDATDTYYAYSSSDGVSWGTSFASTTGGGSAPQYFDSSLNASGMTINVEFRSYVAAAAYALAADAGVFSYSGQAVALPLGLALPAALGTFSYSGQPAALTRALQLAAGQATFSYTGQPAGLTLGYQLVAALGTFSYTGQPAALLATYGMPAAVGTFTYTGQSANLTRAYNLPAALGTFTYNGQPANLARGYNLAAGLGTFSYAGQAAILAAGLSISAGLGTFSYAGQTVNMPLSYRVAAGLGTFAYSGQPSALTVAWKLGANVGTFGYTGQNAGLSLGLRIAADSGSFSYSGQAAQLVLALQLAAGAGIFTYSGYDVADPTLAISLSAATGVFSYSGQPVRYTISGDTFPVGEGGGSSGPRVVVFVL